jgi:hypothetical protein
MKTKKTKRNKSIPALRGRKEEENTIEDVVEKEYRIWKSKLEDILILEEDEWERLVEHGQEFLFRVFYFTTIGVDDIEEETREGIYRVNIIGNTSVQTVIKWGKNRGKEEQEEQEIGGRYGKCEE